MIARVWRAVRQPFRRQAPRPFVSQMRDARFSAIQQSKESIKSTRQTMNNLPSPNFMEAELLARRDRNERA